MRLVRTALVAATLLAVPHLARAGWWDDLDKGESVRLADVVAQPDGWKDKVVTFACIYHRLDSIYQPYFTRFDADHWLNATAWYDGAPIWEMASFRDDEFPFLYIDRAHPQRDEWVRLLPFTRVEITGRVRDVYRKRPFLEVLGFHPTAATLGKHVVEWMKDGDASASVGDYVRAATYYRRVLAELTLDETTSLRVKKRLGETLRAAGLPLEADKADGGGIAGGTSLPKPPGAAEPGASPAAGASPPATAAGPSPVPVSPVPVSPVPVSPVPVSPVTGAEDLPGTPTGAITGSDLPGTPVDAPAPAKRGAPPRSPPPMTLPRREAGTPPTAPTAPCAPPASAAPAPSPSAAPATGASLPAPAVPAPDSPPPPPPRTPRLSGVK